MLWLKFENIMITTYLNYDINQLLRKCITLAMVIPKKTHHSSYINSDMRVNINKTTIDMAIATERNTFFITTQVIHILIASLMIQQLYYIYL